MTVSFVKFEAEPGYVAVSAVNQAGSSDANAADEDVDDLLDVSARQSKHRTLLHADVCNFVFRVTLALDEAERVCICCCCVLSWAGPIVATSLHLLVLTSVGSSVWCSGRSGGRRRRRWTWAASPR